MVDVEGAGDDAMTTTNIDNRLHKVLEALVTLINDWNELTYEPNERGRDNAALVLELWDDGSGRLSKSHGEAYDYHDGMKQPDTLLLNPQCKFKSLDELEIYLSEWLEIES